MHIGDPRAVSGGGKRLNSRGKKSGEEKARTKVGAPRILLLTDQGPVSRTSRELFGPEKPFIKLRPAYSVKLVF